MSAELPWTVAGIPPEAREAARAAARREGLSVGEWLTRRILRGFPDIEEELTDTEALAPSGASLDSWGIPPSAASRRDAEALIARVDGSENESNESWRRIEDQLRGLGRRMDSSERIQDDNSRRLSHSSQEQSKSFDQLRTNVLSLNQRLQRLERSSNDASMREAVKALHLGLSRLADQIVTTARNSAAQVSLLNGNLQQLSGRVEQAQSETAAQVSQLSGNLQQLSGHVEQTHAEAADNHKLMVTRADATDERLTAAEKSVEVYRENLETFQQKFAGSEQRLTANEAALERTADALDRILQKTDETATQRGAELAESQRRVLQTEEGLSRLEDTLARLETRLPDAGLERRLGGIEQSVSDVAARIESYDPRAQFDSALQALSHRLESLEKDHTDLVAEMRAKLKPQEPPAFDSPASHTEPPVVAHFADPAPEYQDTFQHGFAQDPFASQDSFAPKEDFPPQDHSAPQDAFAEPLTDQPGYGAEGTDAFAPGHEPPAAPAGFTFDVPPEDVTEENKQAAAPTPDFGPEFENIFAKPDADEDNFLTQARRSARAASEEAESESAGRIGNFRWGSNEDAIVSSEAEEKKRSRLVIPLVLGLVMALAVLAGVILLQRSTPAPVVTLPSKPAAAVNRPAAPAPKAEQAISPPLVVKPPPARATNVPLPEPSTAKPEPSASAPPASIPAQPRDVTTPPVKPAASTAKPAPSVAAPSTVKPAPKPQASRTPTVERVIQMANAGNPAALTILGLRALDGTNGSPVNLSDAARFLTQAADKGQPVAQYRLGTMYERGQGVPADSVKAAQWYEKSANQGNRKAMHNLAVSYAGRRNMAEAARWFAKAAALGLSDSQFNLAVLYERGEGVPLSLSDAYKWYSIAAAAGDAESKTRIAVLQTQLSDADRATAGKSAAAFRAAPLNRIANVPPEPADLG